METFTQVGSHIRLVCQQGGETSSTTQTPPSRRTMVYDLKEPRDHEELRQIGNAIRGSPTLPHPGDPERWTGGVFSAHRTCPGRITRSKEPTGFSLMLPAAAKTLWDAFSRSDCEGLISPHAPYLGGGTILAARWRHRSSTDIDLFWPEHRWNARDRHAAIETWAKTLSPAVIEISSGTGPVSKVVTTHGDIDFIESRFTHSTRTRDRVEDTRLQALDSSEILAGKVYGRALVPLRGLYDAAVTQLRDPQALCAALHATRHIDWIGEERVNRIPDYCAHVMTHGTWTSGRKEYIRDPSVPDAWECAPTIVADAVNDFLAKSRERACAGQETDRDA